MLLVAEALARGNRRVPIASSPGTNFSCARFSADAPFPEGPMILAAALRVPLSCFQRYTGVDGVMTFQLRAVHRAHHPATGRARRRCCEPNARAMQRGCRDAAATRLTIRFNFYDFWKHDKAFR